MTIQFFLSKNGTARNINLKLTDESGFSNFVAHMPLRISEEEWDHEKQRPKNIYLKKYKNLNNKINLLKIELSEYYGQIKNKEKTISQRQFSKKVKNVCLQKDTFYPEMTLLHFMEQYIHIKKEIICNSTYKRYKVFFNLIQRFEGHVSERLYVEHISSEFIRDFLIFGKQEDYSENTIYRTIHFVKTILNFVERRGIKTRVRELEIRREKQNKEIITLSESEILKIKYTNVPDRLQDSKEWLLISCYTGQRVSDFMKFTSRQLVEINKKKCLNFVQQKTQKEITIPLHPIVQNILHRNGKNFPNEISIQQYNEDIKEIAKLAGLTEMINARKRLGHRTKLLRIEKWKVISSHIGRRSFASNFYGKIPTPLLMEATGHSTEVMFLKYINSFDKDRMVKLSNYFDKMYEERFLSA
ncbi:Site-specific recombinase XerD [Chryseobacterium soldanellicola]|uniref:Site-specific recombinase XerD n=1 Tax=Chryseobacterium soldanellicola TaxID=311333 RepID=A0A1H0XMQ0_9FLAO|nr:phage integrase SAM-like domain-containing protein [Chryseobacterium soldanellicola]SDQ04081.1 Site-specific recombinase XerD [Chryseobacterium soldanellicola]